jgi:hypothetical protein
MRKDDGRLKRAQNRPKFDCIEDLQKYSVEIGFDALRVSIGLTPKRDIEEIIRFLRDRWKFIDDKR